MEGEMIEYNSAESNSLQTFTQLQEITQREKRKTQKVMK